MCLKKSETRKYGYQNKQYIYKTTMLGRTPVAHTCNPSYSGGRDQEDHGLKPAWASSSQDPILKTPIMEKGLV
jgi:hypothetical protein